MKCPHGSMTPELCGICFRLKQVRELDEPMLPKPVPVVMQPHRDITARRHKGNQFSVGANPTAQKKSDDMETIYQGFIARGEEGAVREDVYLSLGFDSNTGSARCSDLKHAGRIVPVWNPDGSHKKGRTKGGHGSPAGIMCADIYGKRRPIQTASSFLDAMAERE